MRISFKKSVLPNFEFLINYIMTMQLIKNKHKLLDVKCHTMSTICGRNEESISRVIL